MRCRQHAVLALASGLLPALLVAGQPAAAQVLTPNLIYTTMQPCRLFDTRVAGGALVANVNRTFNAVAVSAAGSLSAQGGNPNGCPIPGVDLNNTPQVQAIVINLAVVTPSGTGVLQAWPSNLSKPNASVMNFTAAEVVLANGVVLPVRQDQQGMDITLVSNVGTHVLGDVVGYFTAGSPVTDPGKGSLFLGGNGTGNQSVATSGFNTAIGNQTLWVNTTGGFNTALGAGALFSDTTGAANTALGANSLSSLTTGGFNIALGFEAGSSYTSGESHNIVIGNVGARGDNNTIRIGPSGTTFTSIAGINGATSASGTEVFVNANDQLGTTTSSRRFKEDIADMGDASDGLLQLRPVTFYYKAAYDDGSHLLQYGLIAEEVVKTYPELVEVDKDGRPLAVRYHFVNAMLLNEVQKQHSTIATQAAQLEQQQGRLDSQEETIASQAAELAAQQARFDELTARLAKVKALVLKPH
jgi:Chaperone of endosialidase